MPNEAEAEFNRAAMVVTRVLHDIDDLAVLPREIEDILTISTTERHRWLKDGLAQHRHQDGQAAGTR